MKHLNEDIKNKQFKKIYLLYGNEEYLKQFYKKKLKEAAAGNDTMNLLELSGKEIALATVRDFTDTMPFFADHRVLMLEETGLFKNASEGFAEWIETLPEHAIVIFTESEVDKRNKVYKRVQEKGYVCEMMHPDEETLGRWILGRLKSRNLSITRDAYERLLSAVGNDMENVRNEVDKLADYCAGKEGVTAADIDAVVTPVVSSRIFELVEAVAAGNSRKSLSLYYDLLALKEPPMRILFLIARQLNQITLVKEMNAQRKSRDEIASALSVKPFVAGKLSDQARAFPIRTLKEAIRYAVELEEAVKSGDLLDTMAVELLIFRMTVKK